jgi:hypothetical protein
VSAVITLKPKAKAKAKAKAKEPKPDILAIFDTMSNDALLDDKQIGKLANKSTPTIKRYRREGKGPIVTMLNGLPRSRAGDVREWLRAGREASK